MNPRILNRLSEESYSALRDAVESECGIILRTEKHSSLERSVRERMQANGVSDPEEYISNILRGPQGREELRFLIGELVVGETSFFRNPSQFRVLQEHVLPELAANGGMFPFPVWSAGCATGEEAYSIAISSLEAFQDRVAEPVRVHATDIHRKYLKTARDGIYPPSVERDIPAPLVSKYFERLSNGKVKVRDEVRRLVRFEEGNLADCLPPCPYPVRFSVIFCRNVTIYFRAETTRRIMERFHEVLHEGGALFLGHAETLWGISEAFSLDNKHGAYYYRKKGAEPARTLHTERSVPPCRSPVAPRASAERENRSSSGRSPAPMDIVMQASMLANSGSLGEAERLCREATASDPGSQEAAYLLAVILRRKGKYSEAFFYAERAFSLDAQFVLAAVEAAECLHLLGRSTEAAGFWNRVLELLEGPVRPPRFVPVAGFSTRSLREYAKARLMK